MTNSLYVLARIIQQITSLILFADLFDLCNFDGHKIKQKEHQSNRIRENNILQFDFDASACSTNVSVTYKILLQQLRKKECYLKYVQLV